MRAAGAVAVHTIEFDADDLASHGRLVDKLVGEFGPVGTAVLAFGILGDQGRAEDDPPTRWPSCIPIMLRRSAC